MLLQTMHGYHPMDAYYCSSARLVLQLLLLIVLYSIHRFALCVSCILSDCRYVHMIRTLAHRYRYHLHCFTTTPPLHPKQTHTHTHTHAHAHAQCDVLFC
jgi:hypothetical protein